MNPLAEPTVMTTRLPAWTRPIAALMLWGGLAASSLAAPLQACKVDPFGIEPAALREERLKKACGGEHLGWRIDRGVPDVRAVPVGATSVRPTFAHLDSETTEQLWPGFMTSLKMSWSGVHQPDEGGLRTAQSSVAAGSLVRLADSWSLQMNVGRQLTGAESSRATMTGLWQPTRLGLIFAEWAGSPEGTEMQRLGLRWWLLPQRLAIDLGARYLPTSGEVQQRINVTFNVKP